MIIQSKRVWVVNTWMEAQIEIEDQVIKDILPYGSRAVDQDYGEQRIVPGFIDVHTHGFYGYDTNDAKAEGLRYWTEHIVQEGVTGLLPTTITQSEEVLTAAVKNVAKVVNEGYSGAEILGIHFEGPYLDPVYKGAQPEAYCVEPDVEQFKRYYAASEGLIKIITLACEHDRDYRLTKFCVDHDIVVSQGHSGATYAQAGLAIAHGAKSMTHVFNGMTKFHHREPGLVGAAMRYRNVYGEIICDGNHSSYAALNDYFTAKGSDHGIMVSDSLMMKGLPVGTQTLFGGNRIELYPDGSAHLLSTKGLAGSTLRINEGLKVLVEKSEVAWQSAINSCTINPARMLGIDKRKGSLQVGKDADIVVLADSYEVLATYARGKKVF